MDIILTLKKRAATPSFFVVNSIDKTLIQTTSAAAPYIQKTSSVVGGAGGAGGTMSGSGTTSSGGIGGNGFWCGGGYGGGGGMYSNNAGYSRNGGSSEPRPPFNIVWPYPGTQQHGQYGAGAGSFNYGYGGNAPGGGSCFTESGDRAANGDAYGGGAVWLCIGGDFRFSGTISANAGNGGNAGYDSTAWDRKFCCSGGGGGGGIIAVFYRNTLFMNGSMTATGGTAGTTSGGGTGVGVNGSIGAISVKKVDKNGALVD